MSEMMSEMMSDVMSGAVSDLLRAGAPVAASASGGRISGKKKQGPRARQPERALHLGGRA